MLITGYASVQSIREETVFDVRKIVEENRRLDLGRGPPGEWRIVEV
jgi:hypothetical protein